MQIKFKGNIVTLLGERLGKGDRAPDFGAVNGDLSPFRLSSIEGKKLISSVPSLDTGVCRTQTKTFHQKLAEMPDITLITVSLDLPFAQKRFCEEAGINHKVISDYQDREFGEKYGLLIKELKLLSRAVLLLNEGHEVVYTEYLEEVTREPDYEKALEAVRSLRG